MPKGITFFRWTEGTVNFVVPVCPSEWNKSATAGPTKKKTILGNFTKDCRKD